MPFILGKKSERGRQVNKKSRKTSKMVSQSKNTMSKFYSPRQKSTEGHPPLDQLDQEFVVQTEFGFDVDRASGGHSERTGKTQSGDEYCKEPYLEVKGQAKGILDDMEETDYIDIDQQETMREKLEG